MTKHDGSTNTEAFTSSEHALACGQISMALHLQLDGKYDVQPDVTDNDDYLPAVILTSRSDGRVFKVIIAEIVP